MFQLHRGSEALVAFLLLVYLHYVFGEKSSSRNAILENCPSAIPATTFPIPADEDFKYTSNIDFDYSSQNGACFMNITCSGYSAIEIIAFGTDGLSRIYADKVADTSTKELVTSVQLQWLASGWGAATPQLSAKDNRFYCMAVVPGSTTVAPPTSHFDPCAEVQEGNTSPISDQPPFTYSPDLKFSYSIKKNRCVMHLSCAGINAVEIITYLQNGAEAMLNNTFGILATDIATTTSELNWEQFGWGAAIQSNAAKNNMFYCMVIGSSPRSSYQTTTVETTTETTIEPTTSSNTKTTSTITGVISEKTTAHILKTTASSASPSSSSVTRSVFSTTEKTSTSESKPSSSYSTPGENDLSTSTLHLSSTTPTNKNNHVVITILAVVIGILLFLLFAAMAVVFFCWKWRSVRNDRQFNPQASA